jgi:cytidine deaminase
MSKRVTLIELANLDRELAEAAQEVCARAYAPYSLFAVGAAVRSKSGKIHTAANVENASYGLTICAEAAVLSVANAAGDFTTDAIAVVWLRHRGCRRHLAGRHPLRVVPSDHCRGRSGHRQRCAHIVLQWRIEQHHRVINLGIAAGRLWTGQYWDDIEAAALARAAPDSR